MSGVAELAQLDPEDPSSWDRMIDAVGPGSMLVVIRASMSDKLGRRHTAEDVWQETLLQAWKDRHRLEWQGVTAFRRWLITIARNRIADLADRDGALKRRAEVNAIPLESGCSADDRGHHAGPQTTSTPSRIVSALEQAEAMRLALEGLEEEHRDVVRMRLFEGMTVVETAARLGLGESAVRHRFRKGALRYERLLATAVMSQSRSEASANQPAPVAPENHDPNPTRFLSKEA